MKKIGRALLTVILSVVVTQQAAAQWHVGIEAGYANNGISQYRTFDYSRQYYRLGGFTVGVPVRYDFTDWFALQAEATFVQKNYGQRLAGSDNRIWSNFTNSFLEVPVLARFSFGGERLRGFLNVGAYAGWWVDSRVAGVTRLDFDSSRYEAYDQRVPFDARRDNRFEAGLLAGAGLAFRIAERVELSAEVRYLYGLTDLQKQYMLKQVPRYNSTWLCRIGVSWLLPCR